jgi:hypothetical protein
MFTMRNNAGKRSGITAAAQCTYSRIGHSSEKSCWSSEKSAHFSSSEKRCASSEKKCEISEKKNGL